MINYDFDFMDIFDEVDFIEYYGDVTWIEYTITKEDGRTIDYRGLERFEEPKNIINFFNNKDFENKIRVSTLPKELQKPVQNLLSSVNFNTFWYANRFENISLEEVIKMLDDLGIDDTTYEYHDDEDEEKPFIQLFGSFQTLFSYDFKEEK